MSQEDFERAVVRAERLVRNQGGVWEDELECRETLFGDGGVLELWSLDSELRDRFVSLWRQRRGAA
jgi:hypothetical protein